MPWDGLDIGVISQRADDVAVSSASALRVTGSQMALIEAARKRGDKQYKLVAYVESGGKVRKLDNEGTQTFTRIYTLCGGARFAVMFDPREADYLAVNLWDTPTGLYVPEGAGVVYLPDVPRITQECTRRFPIYEAAIAAAVIQAWHPCKPD